MLKELRNEVWRANLELARAGLVTLTWGNVSGFDRARGLVAIKPSGVPYEELKPEHIVVLDLDGRVAEGEMNPSSDTPTHLALYRAFQGIAGVTHTHSVHATMFAQACIEIPCLGTTHADHFHGPVPLARVLTPAEVKQDYEGNTGKVIIERFRRLKHLETPAVLVPHHGPFTWGKNPIDSVRNAIVLEAAAEMALGTLILDPRRRSMPYHVLEKHYTRKHGAGATYGQPASGGRH